jgi:serine/threonine protein kinase
LPASAIPTVVTIYGAERIDGRIGLWMELVKGRTLERRCATGRRFQRRRCNASGVELCRAVAAVHAAGLLHRDIKAQNVMLADDGSRGVDGLSGLAATWPTAQMALSAGRRCIWPPKCWPETRPRRAATFIASGVVLYHLLTGSYPFRVATSPLRRAHSARTTGTLPDASRRIPTRLRRVIARALDPDPAQRHATADLFGASLSGLDRAPLLRAVYSSAAIAGVVVIGLVAWGYRDSFFREVSRSCAPLQSSRRSSDPVDRGDAVQEPQLRAGQRRLR